MPQSFHSQADELFRALRFAEALPLCRQSIDEDPSNWHSWYMAGQCCRFLNDIEGAIYYLSHAAELKTDVPSVLLALGIAFQLDAQWEKAIGALQRAIDIDPDCELAYNSLALTHKKRGELDIALRTYDAGAWALSRRIVKALRNDRSSPIVKHRHTVGKIWSDYAFDIALYSAVKADCCRIAWPTGEQALEEGRTKEHAGLYWIDVQDDKKESMRLFLPNFFATFQEQLKQNNSYSNLIGNKGTVLELLGRTEEARQHFDEATEFLPEVSGDSCYPSQRSPMPSPNDFPFPPELDVWIRRPADGPLELSSDLVTILVTSRSNYDWPQGTGASQSQHVIIALEREVANLLEELDSAGSQQIITKVSAWGGNNANAQYTIEGAPQEVQLRMRDAIRHVLNPVTLRRGLDELSDLPGLRLVMATKIFRFCSPANGAAVDRHASYFFNSLEIIEPNGIRNKSTNLKREWSTGRHTSSRMAIFSPRGHELNCSEFIDVYLPLVTQIAEALNILGVTYRCAYTGMDKNWRPADVEMAAYYWWARNGSR